MAVCIGALRGTRRDPCRAGTPLSQSQVSAVVLFVVFSLFFFPPFSSYIPGLYAERHPRRDRSLNSERIPVKRRSSRLREFHDRESISIKMAMSAAQTDSKARMKAREGQDIATVALLSLSRSLSRVNRRSMD